VDAFEAKGGTMSFLRTWLLGYINPIKLVDELRTKPAPQWGLLGQLVRALLDSLLLYLPLSLMGLIPPTPSHLSFLPTEHYYASLVWLGPIVLIAEMLMQAAVIHIVLRLTGRRSDFDQIVNISGMTALVVGAVLLVWDWIWLTIGGVDQYFMGYSHLVFSLWGVLIMVLGLRRILGVPAWLAAVLSLLAMPVALPFAVMFMRSPL
jgi:hypothetical protein